MPNLNLPPIQIDAAPSYARAGKKSMHVPGKGASTASARGGNSQGGSLLPHGSASFHKASPGGRGASTWQSLGPSLAGLGARTTHGGVSPASMPIQGQTYSTPRSARPPLSLLRDPACSFGCTPSSSSGSGPTSKARAAITGKRAQDGGSSCDRKRVLVDRLRGIPVSAVAVTAARHEVGLPHGMSVDEAEVICLDDSPVPSQPLMPDSVRRATGHDLISRLGHGAGLNGSGSVAPNAGGNVDGRANADGSERSDGGPGDGRGAANGCSAPFREEGSSWPPSQQADSWMLASQLPPAGGSQAQASQVSGYALLANPTALGPFVVLSACICSETHLFKFFAMMNLFVL